ncbi:Zn(2)-Cys(6) binuclear cluster domain-containing protein [Lyophyllum atratum]|nr:Zn(2)-Cys(6) binuclear cluster domain-containing protein [Lyophyllum atratum]
MLKGKACMNCRRRKIKCDSDRPSCGQCARSNGAFEDCEYPGGGLTQTQILEDRISHLQSRIRQLENVEEATDVPLHQPYSHDSPPRFDCDAPLAIPSGKSSPISQPSSSSSSPASVPKNSFAPTPVQEPPMDIMLLLVNTFYQHCPRFGFFLNIDRFHQSFLLSLPIGHHARPTPSLLNAIYLWGSHLSPSLPEGFDEKTFLRNALYHLSKDLSSSHPQKIVHGIQAEVLLSYYYLKHGKVLGGNYHANAAVSLSLSCGLHRIRTPGNPRSTSTPSGSPRMLTTTLPTPADGTEEGERIDAFWAVLILNNYWIAIQESHSMFFDLQNIGVDTPWPMDMIEYELQLLPRVSSDTIKRFLESTTIEGFSVMALHAKAAVLLEQATIIRGSTPSELDPMAGTEPWDAFTRLDMLVDQFKTHFPLVDQMDGQPSDTETLIVMKMMTHVATIKLHLPLSDEGNAHSRQKSLLAAQAIAVLTHSITPTSVLRIDPIIGVLWTAACEVFVHELLKVDSPATGNNPQWSTLLHSVLSQMNKFSSGNVLMKFLVNRLQKNHPAAVTFW